MPEMTRRQVQIWTRLNTAHRGHRNAVTWADLSEILQIPDRRLREAVEHLVTDHHKPIGSHQRYGVFVCVDAQDYQLARTCLTKKGRQVFERVKALEKSWNALQAQRAEVWRGTLFEGMGV